MSRNRVRGVVKECGNNKKGMTPKGHVVVYVGEAMSRQAVPISYLKNQEFQRLLEEAADVYGFHGHGPIMLPCDEDTFRTAMTRSEPRIQ